MDHGSQYINPSPRRAPLSETLVREKVEHVLREVRKLENISEDARIRSAVQDAALQLKSRLSVIKRETMEAQISYFEEEDDREFLDRNEENRH